MLKRIVLVVFCGVAVFFTLFLYWQKFHHKGAAQITIATRSITLQPLETPSTELRQNPDEPTLEVPTVVEETYTAAEETPETEEIIKAINFLDALNEQNSSENITSTEDETVNNTTKLDQDELFQLIREGVSYYDKFLETGSITFFVESWSQDSGQKRRSPNGTWEGSFEFSGNQIRGTVTEDVLYYEKNGTSKHRQSVREFAYDGETYETLRETPQGMQLERQSEPYTQPDLDPRFWGWNLSGSQDLVEMIDALDIMHIEPVMSKGRDIYYINGNVGDVEVELWMNPETSFRPERYSFAIRGDTHEKRITKEYSFQELAPDLWFPIYGNAVTTIKDLNTGIETDISGQTFQASNVRINEYIPSSRFSIDPPSGTNVSDVRNGTIYKTE